MADFETSTARLEQFGYICNSCNRCCYDKDIQLNPYEIARLARRLGLSATQFREAWTKDSAGTRLQQTRTGACAFLGTEGCTVHSDRPLVCRLYPLGRHVGPDHSERFTLLDGHPESAGQFTNDSTIGKFLETQGALPFLAAADDYFDWCCAANEQLEIDWSQGSNRSHETQQDAFDFLDMDAAITNHCQSKNAPEPEDLEERKKLHLNILYQRLNNHG
jgi:uncharacterized protein